MEEEELMKLTLIDKLSGQMHSFENSSYSQLISKAYGHMLKELRKELSKKGAVLRSMNRN